MATTATITPKSNIFLTILTVLAALATVGVVYMSLFYAPTEVTMGEVQRLFYIHVSTAWVGSLAFGVVLVSGIVYLIRRQLFWDRLALASAEIGLCFMLIATVNGAVWGRPVWNTWWTWDPRLTTTTVVILLYAAYLLLRQAIEDPHRRALFASVYGILSFVSVPVTFLSIRIWRTIHPVVIGSGDPEAMGSMNMTPPMQQTFLFSMIALTIIYAALTWHRMRLAQMQENVEQLKYNTMRIHG